MTLFKPNASRAKRRGFTLLELMISVFILGIGMIMVITIFPIGGDWTRQATESTLSQVVAQNALAILQSRTKVGMTITSSTAFVPFPGMGTTIPASEMCFQYGANPPCPADPTKATYFWTAIIRATPGQPVGVSKTYDLYILVFKKGTPDQTYGSVSAYYGATDMGSQVNSLQPTAVRVNYLTGNYDSSTRKVLNAVPAVGEYGIGAVSGTVFRQGTNFSNGDPTTAVGYARPQLSLADTQVIVGLPLMSGGAVAGPSPLVYVYQTTITR